MVKLKIYFNSGNQVIIDKVQNWDMVTDDGQIKALAINQKRTGLLKCKNRLIVKSLNLSNIDCIIEF